MGGESVEGFVTEALRYLHLGAPAARAATADLSVEGQVISRGSLVHLGVANRDEAAFRRPNYFLAACPAPSHRSFGYGPHSARAPTSHAWEPSCS